ncbi:MAG: NfeD family protein [Clostridiales bacterium]|nr:NfeD family protein [Clostridiales bacterium]
MPPLIEYMPYVWVTIIICAVLLEAATTGLVAIWFMPGALLALILSLFNLPVWLQSFLFFLLSAILLICNKTVFRRLFKKRPIVATNVDAIIGKQALVIEKIDNINGQGLVKINSQIWTARSADPDRIYPEGELVKVVALEGVKLICE